MVLSGFWCLMFLTASNQLVQTSSNMAIRGRVMSLYIMVLIGGQAIGGPMIGWHRRTRGPARRRCWWPAGCRRSPRRLSPSCWPGAVS